MPASQQNWKAERMIRTVNNVRRTLLFQASMPPSYWADALATATYLINGLPTKTLHMSTPFFALHGSHPSYHNLRGFGCTCYPNLSATTPHKLAPHSTLCAFLGYSALTSPPTVSSFHATLSLTRQHFPSPTVGHPHPRRNLIF